MKKPEKRLQKADGKPSGAGGGFRQIWDYYKLHLAVAAIILYGIGFAAVRHVTHKDVRLYAALVNVAPGEKLMEQLSDGFFDAMGFQSSSEEFRLLGGWYLTTEPDAEVFQYVQASQMKILASIDAEQLDVVLMDKEAFDAFAQNGYLYDLDVFQEKLQTGGWEFHPQDTSANVREILEQYAVENMEILEDNAKEVALNPEVSYQSKTRTAPMAVDLSESPVFAQAGFEEPVYFGILSNTPRPEMAAAYLNYIFDQ